MSEGQAQTFLAKALYDNIAETPDELAFRRGDVITIVEQDTNGLEGWWLCSLRGKQGIAPGNRLKLLSGMFESPRNSFYDSLPGERIENSWESTPNKERTPQKLGERYTRTLSNRSMQDYDVPPSRQLPDTPNRNNNPQENYNTPPNLKHSVTELNESSFLDDSLYDTPPSQKRFSDPNIADYDAPPSHDVSHSLSAYDVLPTHGSRDSLDECGQHSSSNRSSLLSNLSNLSQESTMTISSSASNHSVPRRSNPASTCDSARSSMDISPQDFYDVPPSAPKTFTQFSTDSGLDVYDSPPKQKSPSLDFDQTDYDTPPKPKPMSPGSLIEDYDIPKSKLTDFEQAEVEHAYEEPDGPKEHAVDDMYDIPKNNTPVRSLESSFSRLPPKHQSTSVSAGVYDIPPQVTRDSILSVRSDSSDGTNGERLSMSSLDSRGSDIPIYDELPLDLDAAMDLMVKLQQDVQKSTTRLSSFVSSSWRQRDAFEPKLYDIKLACMSVKTSLEEFVDFAQGTLANSAKLPDRKVVNKLYKHLSPLQSALKLIKLCMKNLDVMKWQPAMLVTSEASKDDDLGQIANTSKDLTSEVKKLASVIQGNSTLLFKRAQDINQRKEEDRHSSKPPIKPKPSIGPKPLVLPGNGGGVQQRPLPAPPMTSRPLPLTPTDEKKRFSGDFKRFSGEYKRQSGDFKRFSGDFKQLSMNIKLPAEKDSVVSKDVKDDLEEEYDYVRLEARDIAQQKKCKEEVEKQKMLQSSGFDREQIKRAQEKALEIEEDEQDLKTPVNRDMNNCLPQVYISGLSRVDPNDKQVLVFYSGQLETHSTLLSNAVDAFFNCIENNQPPKVFISHSKFVVVSAHKLVYIGDSLHKNLISNDLRNKIIECANHLCENLKQTVTATKSAALQYPSVAAVKDMVDHVTGVSHSAHEFRLLLSQAAAL